MLRNHGTFWDNRDLRNLKRLMKAGVHIKKAAAALERTPSSCSVMWREIQRMEMMQNGLPADTLVSWKKRQREAA